MTTSAKKSRAAIRGTPRPARSGSAKRASTAPHHTAGPDWHRQMVEEAAYYLAEKRGFANGDPVADWLAAEAQIDAQFGRR